MNAPNLLKAVARAAWNGPFYVGRLTRPASLGDAMLKLLETLWRAGIVCLASIAAIIVAAVAGDYWSSDFVKSPPISTLQPSIEVPSDCGRNYPILIAITNGGQKTVNSVNLRLEARHPGRSTDLVTFGSSILTDDSIIKAGEVAASCWKIPELSEPLSADEIRALRWTVRIESAVWAE